MSTDYGSSSGPLTALRMLNSTSGMPSVQQTVFQVAKVRLGTQDGERDDVGSTDAMSIRCSGRFSFRLPQNRLILLRKSVYSSSDTNA